MANIDFLVYNTTSVAAAGPYYRVVRYGVCDSADLAGQAYETNDVAIQNTAGEVPEYYNDGVSGYYPMYKPSTNVLGVEVVTEAPPYDPATDPTNHRTQADAYDDTTGVLLKRFNLYGSFGLGSTAGKQITDFTAAAPKIGFYTADESTVVGGPTTGGTDDLIVRVEQNGFLNTVFHAYLCANPYREWVGYRAVASTGAVTWIETTPGPKQNPEYLWTPTDAAAGFWRTTVGSGTGTFANTLPTNTSKYTMMKRALYSSVATTANQIIGQRQTERVFFRGVAGSGLGGFYFSARFGFDNWTNGARFFAGLHTATTVVSADPSALNHTCGFAVDAADNGLIHFQTRNSATTTRVSTGLTITDGAAYEIEVFCEPSGTEIEWRIKEITSGVVASGVATATLPATTVGNALGVLASNAALTAVDAVQLGVARIYAKTDY